MDSDRAPPGPSLSEVAPPEFFIAGSHFFKGFVSLQAGPGSNLSSIATAIIADVLRWCPMPSSRKNQIEMESQMAGEMGGTACTTPRNIRVFLDRATAR